MGGGRGKASGRKRGRVGYDLPPRKERGGVRIDSQRRGEGGRKGGVFFLDS